MYLDLNFNIHPGLGFKYWVGAQLGIIITDFLPVRIPPTVMDMMHFTFWGCGILVSVIALIEWIGKKYTEYKEKKNPNKYGGHQDLLSKGPKA